MINEQVHRWSRRTFHEFLKCFRTAAKFRISIRARRREHVNHRLSSFGRQRRGSMSVKTRVGIKSNMYTWDTYMFVSCVSISFNEYAWNFVTHQYIYTSINIQYIHFIKFNIHNAYNVYISSSSICTMHTFHTVQYTQCIHLYIQYIHFIKFTVIQWMYTFHCSTLYKCNEYIFCNAIYIFYCDTHSIYTFHCSMYNFNAYI